MGAIANNSEHNSFEMPYRDFLKKNSTSPSGAEWSSPWDDMTTAYGSQFPVLIGTAGITWELPVYSDVTAERVVPYGLMTQAMFIRDNKISMLTNQAKLFERGVNNTNSNADVAYEGVAVPSTPDTPETPDTPNPAKSATGDTMNEGTICIHGSSGDATGYAMRGHRELCGDSRRRGRLQTQDLPLRASPPCPGG